jgi:hypothetical protein
MYGTALHASIRTATSPPSSRRLDVGSDLALLPHGVTEKMGWPEV